LETPWAAACEKYIHDLLENEPGSRRIRAGAGTEFFEVASDKLHRVFAEAESFIFDFKEVEAAVLELVEVVPDGNLLTPDQALREAGDEL
jgi:hypothetical protein